MACSEQMKKNIIVSCYKEVKELAMNREEWRRLDRLEPGS